MKVSVNKNYIDHGKTNKV